jgi:Mrp family chromosome partitioning ATPase
VSNMGKILEALRQPALRRSPAAEPAPVPRAYQPEADLEGDTESAMPFIEVGGRQQIVEGSPEVLAGPDGQPAVGPVFRPVAPPAPVARPTGPRAVVFRAATVEMTTPAPPEQRFAPELVAYHQPAHPVSEQYRAVAEALIGQLPAGRAQAVLFTAAMPEVGTTTALLNIAITIARAGKKRVAVIDANLGRPAVAERLGLARTSGWREVLAGSAALPIALQEMGQPGLSALTAGVTVAGGRVPPTGPGVRAVLEQLRADFDLVLVDAPCWEDKPALTALRSACDAVCLILNRAEAETPAAQELLRAIPRSGCRLLGCLLTEVAA